MTQDVVRHGELDSVRAAQLQKLVDGYHQRATRGLGVRLIDGHLVKLYAIEAPGRRVDAAQQHAALDLAAQELGAGDACVGLAVVIVHAGGDGDYVIVQSWIADYMTRLAVFVGPADEPQELRPAPSGLGPCVWEAAVLAHERTAFVDHVLAGHGPLQLRLTAWAHDTFAAQATVAEREDWYAWHAPYAEAGSPLSRRLRLVQQHITGWLDERPEPRLTVVSVCAGQGNDLLDVLADRPDAGRVRAHLIEYDPRNVAAARARIDSAGLTGAQVRCADAGHLEAYAGTVPADLVLLAGVLGNISDADVQATIAALPMLCAVGATVIWTRTRRTPDLTGQVRQWLAAAGFTEVAFHAPDDVLFSVGVHRFTGEPQPLRDGGKLFTFLR